MQKTSKDLNKDTSVYTEDIQDVLSVQNKLKEHKSFITPKLPKDAKLKRLTLTKDLAYCLVFVYRYYAFHPKAEFGQYYRKEDLFAELKQNVGKELADKITRSYRRLKHWDLLVPMPISSTQVIYKKGWWGITEFGAKFIQKDIGLPKYAEVYNDFVYNHITKPVMITDLIPQEELTELLAL
jgi:hypothetical protein